MNRHERRGARKRPLLGKLTGDDAKVMEALLRCWLRDSEAGRQISETLSEDEAYTALCGVIDRRLARVKVIEGPGDTLGVSVELAMQGGRA
jgi:hypothetical protein